jgi:tRNA-splicing ligase RtcB
MSFLQRIERHTDNHYVLPRVGAMCVDVHAFLSPMLFAQTNEALWQQAAQAAAYPGMLGLYLMPDTHLGYGIPVGGVAVTDGVIIQAGSGYDISCFFAVDPNGILLDFFHVYKEMPKAVAEAS